MGFGDEEELRSGGFERYACQRVSFAQWAVVLTLIYAENLTRVLELRAQVGFEGYACQRVSCSFGT